MCRIHALLVAAALLIAPGAALAQNCANFGDVSASSPFCQSVEWVKNRAVTLGCGDGSNYCPSDPVTRLQMAIFLNRLGTALTPLDLAPAVSGPVSGISPAANPVLCPTADFTVPSPATPPFAIYPFPRRAVITIKFFIEGHGMTREAAGALNSSLPFAAMIATPLFGLLVDRVGKRALFMMVGSFLLMPVYLMLVYTDIPPIVPMALMGVAFSLIPAVLWPSVAYIVDPKRLGSAYALMTLIQQIGLAGMNQAIGWANDASRASAENPGGYALGMWIFSILGFLGFFYAWMLRREETSPRGHGLETIKP